MSQTDQPQSAPDEKPGHAAPDSGVADDQARYPLGKRPVFTFVVTFAVIMIPFTVFFFAWFSKTDIFNTYLNWNASLSGWLLNVFGEDIRVTGASVIGKNCSLQIKHGCDAIFPSALFVAAVVASPLRFRLKIPGILIGSVVLLSINLVRIISLYYVRLHLSEKSFHIMHVDVWQPAFIILALLFWIIWALRATKQQVRLAS